MKTKLIAALLAVCLLPAACAAAEGAAPTANGVAEAKTTVDVTAPYSGVLLPFDWDVGDTVAAGEALFALDTVKVYAPESGTLAASYVAPGDSADDAMKRYGVIAYVERECNYVMSATTSGAYNEDENKRLHVGELLYIEAKDKKDDPGTGRVLAVTDRGYTVQVLTGEYALRDSRSLYRGEKLDREDCVGKGVIGVDQPVAVTGTGRVLQCLHQQGDAVEKGELLFELALGEAEPDVTGGEIAAPMDAAVGALYAVSGQSVYKGQRLATLHDLSVMQVVAEVDELDLGALAIGDRVTLVFDRYPDTKVEGTVAQIGSIGVSKQNATYYNVRIDLTDKGLSVLPGMNATVYLPAQE